MHLRTLRWITPIALAAVVLAWGSGQGLAQNFGPLPGVNYGAPNYANSPPLQKFVDSLPGLSAAGANTRGMYLPVAIPDTTTYQNSDYYEIGLKDYTQQLHQSLPPTKLRGYYQINTTDPTVNTPHYLGPVIVAQSGRPVRIKFTNNLATGTAGNLFLPVDTTIMGAGMGPFGMTPPVGPMEYSQNRAVLHLHGGVTPWISDGTPHQWVTPAGEVTAYPKGVAQQNVPDMPDPGPGSETFYYTNQQSARLMFYHDHAYGMTRLNVYAGEAAGYVLTDATEQALIANGTLPNPLGGLYTYGVPLIIQDKTFVADATTTTQTDPTRYTSAVDPLWNPALWGAGGSLWFPHVYMPNQDPTSPEGASQFGRWDWGPWFWPIFPVNEALPQISAVPEAFMDTPLVNGQAYPYFVVKPTQYRFRVLNACNDRYLNLGVYFADTGGGGTGATATATVTNGQVTGITVIAPGTGYTVPPIVNISDSTGQGATATATVAGGAVTGFTIITPGSGYSATPSVYLSSGGVGGTGATATATIANGAVTAIAVGAGGSGYTSPPGIYFVGGGGSCAHAKATILNGAITAITVTDGGSGYTTAPTVLVGASTEVKMVEAIPCNLPQNWAADGRDGGLPDPATSGPPIIQIGTEGGIQPAPVVIPSTPVGYNYNRRDIVVLNVSTHGLFLGPAERSDIIIDFSQCPPGSKLILYNDAPAPVPAFDPRNDYYTGDPDQTDMGGAPTTPPGWGPNTRTVMQFIVDPAGTPAPKPTLLPSLNAALPTAFAASQPPLPVPAGVYARISDTSLNTGAPAGIDTVQVLAGGSGYTSPPTIGFVGGGGSGAIATAVLTAGSISAINVTTQGAGYTTTPTVTITGGGGSGGMAYAHIAGATTLLPKAIQELFDLHGRMNATLGVELPFTTALVQTTIPLGYVDPPTETVLGGQTQLWKITHNGVDTHAIHVHLFNAQVINRVGWDGAIRPPLPEEIGWKETIKMNPLEDIIIAVQPIIPTLPFKLGDSIRPLDVTMPLGTSAQFTGVDPNTGNPVTVTNQITNFGWEYVWHCHLLGHEENDMMRPLVALVSPAMPTNLHATTAALPMSVTLTWTNAATTPAATVYSVRRSTNALFTANVVTLPTQPLVGAPTIVDASVTPLTTYYYEVRAENAAAYSQWTAPLAVTTPAPPIPAVPTNLRTTGIGTTFVILAWNYTANNAPAQGFRVQRLIGTTWTTIATTGATTLTYRVNGLTTKTQYQFRVQSFNASGPSAFTPTLTVTTN